jgi:hypothetical protein
MWGLFLSILQAYEVYVEGVKSTKYICLKDQLLLRVGGSLNDCQKIYGEIPYERVIEFIDLENSIVTRSILVLREEPSLKTLSGYLIEEGAQVCLQEIRGKFIYFLINEGSSIKRGDIVAYHVTGKLEVRNVISKCEGQVVLVVDMPWETPRKAILVVISGEYRRVIIGKSA